MLENIHIKIVDQYPKETFNDLIKRNLEDDLIFIHSLDYCGPGDESFAFQGKRVNIAAYDEDKLIGLSWGKAETKNRFIMHMSLVEKPYRNQGIYSKMLDVMLEQTKDFDEVDSYHHIFNNQILTLKLKAGFCIIGLDQTTMLGPRVKLRYFHNPKLLDIMKYRMGMQENPVR